MAVERQKSGATPAGQIFYIRLRRNQDARMLAVIVRPDNSSYHDDDEYANGYEPQWYQGNSVRRRWFLNGTDVAYAFFAKYAQVSLEDFCFSKFFDSLSPFILHAEER